MFPDFRARGRARDAGRPRPRRRARPPWSASTPRATSIVPGPRARGGVLAAHVYPEIVNGQAILGVAERLADGLLAAPRPRRRRPGWPHEHRRHRPRRPARGARRRSASARARGDRSARVPTAPRACCSPSLVLVALTWGTWGDLVARHRLRARRGPRSPTASSPYPDFPYYLRPARARRFSAPSTPCGISIGARSRSASCIATAIVGLTYAVARLLRARPAARSWRRRLAAVPALGTENISFVMPHSPSALARDRGSRWPPPRRARPAVGRRPARTWLLVAGVARGRGSLLTRPEFLLAAAVAAGRLDRTAARHRPARRPRRRAPATRHASPGLALRVPALVPTAACRHRSRCDVAHPRNLFPTRPAARGRDATCCAISAPDDGGQLCRARRPPGALRRRGGGCAAGASPLERRGCAVPPWSPRAWRAGICAGRARGAPGVRSARPGVRLRLDPRRRGDRGRAGARPCVAPAQPRGLRPRISSPCCAPRSSPCSPPRRTRPSSRSRTRRSRSSRATRCRFAAIFLVWLHAELLPRG